MSVLQTINFDSIEYIDANYNKFEDVFLVTLQQYIDTKKKYC